MELKTNSDSWTQQEIDIFFTTDTYENQISLDRWVNIQKALSDAGFKRGIPACMNIYYRNKDMFPEKSSDNRIVRGRLEYLNKRFKTNEGEWLTVIEYIKAKDCTIKFDDGTILNNIDIRHVREGGIKNPNRRSNFGIGYLGIGKYTTVCKHGSFIINDCWTQMLRRCYSKKVTDKHIQYKDVTVCEEWHNFQNFAKWFEENYNHEIMQGWHLDKDILVKGNRVYSPETCCFVPVEINSLFTTPPLKDNGLPVGITKSGNRFWVRLSKFNMSHDLGKYETKEEAVNKYKTEKLKYIKEVAEMWKDKIDNKVYKAMINYKL